MHEGFTGQPADPVEPPSIEWVPVESVKHGNVFIKAVVNSPGERVPFNDDWREETTVGTAWDASDGENPDWKGEQRANGRLMAAAPSMYHALQCAAAGKGDWRGLVDAALELADTAEVLLFDS